MAMVESGTKGCSERVGRIDDAGDVLHNNFVVGLPLLDGKMLNVNMARAGRRTAGVDHENGRRVVFVERGGAELRITKLGKDGAKIFSNFGSMDGGEEFSFGGTGGDGRLDLSLVGNGAAAEHENKAGDGSTSDEVGSMGSINVASEQGGTSRFRESRERRIGGQGNMETHWERRERGRSPIQKAPGFRHTEVTGHAAKGIVVNFGGVIGETSESCDRIANVGTGNNVSVDKSAEDAAVGGTGGKFQSGISRGIGERRGVIVSEHLL